MRNVIFFLFLLSFVIQGQSYLIKEFNMRTGLPHWAVNDVVQTSDGRICIATPTCLSFYDGTAWHNFNNSTGKSPRGYIKFFKTETGELWALPGDSNLPVLKLNDQNWQPVSDPNTNFVLIDFLVSNTEGDSQIFTLSDDSQLFLFRKNWEKVNTEIIGEGMDIYSIHLINKQIYILSETGIYLYENGQVLPADKLNSITGKYKPRFMSYEFGKFFLLGPDWLGKIEDGMFSIIYSELDLSTGTNRRGNFFLEADRETRIYFGNFFVVYCYDTFNGTIHKISSEKVNKYWGGMTMEIDYENNLWLSSPRGLQKIRISPFTNFYIKDGLYDNEVSAIFENSKGQLLFGQTGAISIKDISGISKIPFGGEFGVDIYSRVMDYCEDSRGRVWFVAYKAGLGRVEGKKIIWVNKDGQLDYNSIDIDGEGRIWLGTSLGIYYFEKGQLHLFNEQFRNFVRKIQILPDGSIFAATSTSGLVKLKDGNIQFIIGTSPRESDCYNFLNHPEYGTLVGTQTGLYKVVNTRLVKFEKDGFKIDWPVYFLFSDSKNNCWFGTRYGVVKWTGDEFIVYNSTNGLAGDETNRSAIIEDSKGKIWIGTDKGLSCFDKEFSTFHKTNPKGELIAIEDYLGREIYDFNNMEFEADKSITFRFRAYSYIDETQNQYHLELINEDGKIIDASIKRENSITYPALKPGRYTWTMCVENSVGIKSGIVKTVQFDVLIPFVQSYLFKILVAFTGFIIVLVVYYNFTRIRRTQNLRLLVDEKTSELNKNLNEKQRVEEELLDSEKTLKMMTNSTYEGIAIHKQGTLVLVNKQLTEMFGYTEEELIGSDSLRYFTEADHGIIINKIKSSDEECYRVNGRRKNGELFPVEMRSHPAHYKGEKVRVVAVRDITETVEFEKTLLYKNQFEKMISEISSNFINLQPQQISDQITLALSRIANFINADSGYILLFHDNGKKMSVTNLWQNENIHLDINKLQNLDVYEMPVWCKLLLNGEPVNFPNISELSEEAAVEKKILSAWDIGSLLDIPILIEGQTVGVIGFDSVHLGREWSDDEITKLRLAGQIFFNALTRKKYVEQIVVAKEKAEASDKLKTEFLAQMSHEIRTPINVMLNYLSLVEEKVGDEKDVEMQYCFDGVDNAGRRIIRTIDSILNVSELQQGLYDYRPRDIDLKEIVQNLILEHKSTAMGKKLTLELLTDLNSAYVNIDEYSITQTLANLIDNAIKYTENGGVSVKMFRTEEAKLITEVTDTGIGIADDFLKNLFNPFSQEEQGYTRKYEGNGLGLTLVKKYCEMNNTEIEVESHKNVGTTFRLKFNGPS